MIQKLIARYKQMRTERYLTQTFRHQYAFVGMGQHSLSNLYPVLHYLGVPLKYICVTSERKAALIEQKFPGIKGTASLDEMLGDETVGGVFVSASPSAHFSIASQVLLRGKSLFIEKPLCQSLEQLDTLIDLQRTAGSHVAMVGLQKRYAPAVQMLKQRLRKEQLVSYDLHYLTGAYPDGDALLDLYIHPLDLVTALFGEAEILSCREVAANSYLLMLRHEQITGTLELSTSYTWTDAEETLKVCTASGVYQLSQMEQLAYTKKQPSFLGIPMEKVRPRHTTVEYLYQRNNFTPVMTNNQVFSQGYFGEIETFVNAVEGAATPVATNISEIRKTYSILEKMRKCLPTLLFLLMSVLPVAAQSQKDHNFEVAKHLDIFNNLYKNLDLLYVDTINPKDIIGTGINAMLRRLDPYTEYYAQDETKNLRMMLTGKYAGIGALIRKHQKLDRVVIDEPYENMPAAEAGLKKGDVILSIDDTLMTDKEVGYVSSHLRGEAGTSFLLKVMRPSTGKMMKFKITRKNIKLPDLPYYGMREGNIGYINFNQFTQESAKEVRRAFVDLKKRGATSLIFDLRNNGGGSEAEAVDIVNLWVPKGVTVVENRGKVRQASRAYKTRLEPVDTVMPIVVLVNGESASASEITSGALQDLDRAVILGTRTYGKGLVQIPIDLPYNTNMKVTTSKYYIPSGRCIQAINYKQGSVGYREHIPDSLTKVFHTAGGREVRDGGGIKPDMEVKADTIPNIAFYLSASGQDSTEVMFDYVVDYIAQHPTIAPAADFHLTDADWADFKSRVIKNGFTYDPVSKKQFAELVKTAKFEGYYDDAKGAFDELEKKLNHDVAFDLEKHKAVLLQVLEADIIAAYYYQAGSIEASLNYDRQLREAEHLLRNPEEYKKLLAPQK